MIDCPVYPASHQVDPDLLLRLGRLATSLISDSMDRIGGASGLVPFTDAVRQGDQRMVGHALTVRTARGDNLIVHQALEMLLPDHVLAVDAGGALDRAIVGEIMCSYAQAQGAAGVVIDGAIRDSRSLRSAGIPVFATGCNHQGPYKNGPGSIGGIVTIGGSILCPGDVIVGDTDGVVIVPLRSAWKVVEAAEAREVAETKMLREIREGSYRNDWLPQMVNLVQVEE